MNFAEIEADVKAALARLRTAIAWILDHAAAAEVDVQELEAASPLVKTAIEGAEAAATAEGIPIATITAGVETALAMAKQITAAKVATPAA